MMSVRSYLFLLLTCSSSKLVVDEPVDEDTFFLPILDFSKFLGGDEASQEEFLAELKSAITGNGFFYLINSGIPTHLMKESLQDAATWFKLPLEKKMGYIVETEDGTWGGGYRPTRTERVYGTYPDEKEAFDVYVVPGGPRDLESFTNDPHFEKTRLPTLLKEMEILSVNVLKAIDRISGTNALITAHTGPQEVTEFRILSYPPLEEGAKGKLCGPHTDYSTVTLLIQDHLGGLEIYDMAHKKWEAATPIEGAVVVNIANMLQRWSNDEYISTMHRVMPVETDVARNSIAYFVDPDFDAVIDLDDFGIPKEEQKYPPIRCMDHLTELLDDTLNMDGFKEVDYGAKESLDPICD